MNVLLWLWRRFCPVEGRLEFLLLILATLGAAVGGIVARWVPGSEIFWHTALVAVLLGRLLGRSKMRAGWAAVLLSLVGLVYAVWSVTHLTPPLWAALGAAWRQEGSLALFWLREAGTRLLALLWDVLAWLRSWSYGSAPPAATVSLLWMALVLWGSAAFAGWSLLRGRRPLFSFLPLSAVLALSVFVGGEGSEFLLLVLACVVMMTPLTTLRRQEQRWDAQQVPYSEEFRFDVRVVAVLSTVVFLALALVFPNVRVQAVVDWFREQLSGPQQAVEGVLRQTFPGARPGEWGAGRAVGAVLPREHLLGESPELGRTEVMEVRLDDPLPPWDPIVGEARPREVFYWRGTSYGEYVGAGWHPAGIEEVELPAYAALGPPEQVGRRPLRQEFRLLVPHEETLYAAGDPQTVDRPVMVQRLPGEGGLVSFEGRFDRYQVVSLVPRVTAAELAAASTEYPPDLAQVYLSPPGSLPPRVVDLAQEVAGEVETSYGRALALQAYLRSFPYDLQVARPPEGRDVVDYFLFDLQRGYCDYYASAMVVMARAVGVPARLAAGYTMGHYDPQRGAYVVTEQNGHTWPELYFPGYGWIPFEPTAGFVGPSRAEDAGGILADLAGLPAAPQRSWWVRVQVEARLLWLRWRWWVLLGAAGAVVTWVGWRLWHRRAVGLTERGRVALRYLQLREHASRLGVAVVPGDTPGEVAAAASQVLLQRRPHLSWVGGMLRRAVERALLELSLVTRVYERVSYAAVLPDAALLRRAWREGGRLQWRLWQVRLLSGAPGPDLGA